MLQIELEEAPYHEADYLNAAPQKKRAGFMRARLPFIRGGIGGLPGGAPPLLATGDLQGRSDFGDSDETLLGCWVAENLAAIHEAAGLPHPGECIGLLAGDLYTVPNATSRGGTGDVTEVWYTMQGTLGALAGVSGNHDRFGRAGCPRRPPGGWLDGEVREFSGLTIGGVSGIVGNPEKESRKAEHHFAELLAGILAQRPAVVVLHASPHLDDDCPGSSIITQTIEAAGYDGLIVCGHVPWKRRLRVCGQATCLNVHEAVVTLLPVA